MASPSTESACDSISSVATAYIGNLRSDCPAKQLEKEIQSFFQAVGVVVADDEVKAFRKSSKKPAYAFVNLKDKSTFDFVVEKLNGLPSPSRKELIFSGANLKISQKKLSNNEPKTAPSKSKKTRRHSKNSKHHPSSGKLHTEKYQPETGLVVMGKGSGSMATSSVTIATSTTTLVTSNTTMKTNILNGSEYVTLDPKKRYYLVGQKLRAEDRLTEYKQGGGNYLDSHFKIDLAKYVCAFLNTEGGTLIVGVQDSCTVCGVKISSKKEDLLRLEIDQIMKGFNPPVFTNSYSITFVPVYASPVLMTRTSIYSVPITNTKNLSANLADLSHDMPVTTSKQNGANSIDRSQTSPVAIIAADNEGSNSLEMYNSGDHINHPPANSSSSENGRKNEMSWQHVLPCAPERLPPLKTSLSQTTHPSLQVLNKPECDNIESSNEASFGEVSGLQGSEMISEGIKAVKTDLKVIEVKVHCSHREDSTATLYETNKGEVYLRRDGSIQGPLKPSQILAWSEQNLNKNHNFERTHLQQEIVRKQEEIEMNMKLVNELVKQKDFLKEQYQEKIEKLKENEDKLNAEISLLRSQEAEIQDVDDIKRNRSKVCIII